MIALASGLRIGVGMVSRPLSGVGVIAMPNTVLDSTCRVEVRPGAGVLWLTVTGVAVGVFIDHHCVADGVEVTR
jgi:hypothetical protein